MRKSQAIFLPFQTPLEIFVRTFQKSLEVFPGHLRLYLSCLVWQVPISSSLNRIETFHRFAGQSSWNVFEDGSGEPEPIMEFDPCHFVVLYNKRGIIGFQVGADLFWRMIEVIYMWRSFIKDRRVIRQVKTSDTTSVTTSNNES